MALQFYNSMVAKSVQCPYWKNKSGIGIFQKSIIDTIYSIQKSSKRLDISSIFKALVKNNTRNIDTHTFEKEVTNM